jgi:RimJ/RimL family protein N-acetyltransferase
MKGPERIETARLLLRKPTPAEAESIFSRYASDPEVTRYLSWPTHSSIEQTKMFLTFSDAEWEQWPAGPYLIESKEGRQLLGGTGLAFETLTIATTGYVLARDAWGRGYATEALGAMVRLAHDLGTPQLVAQCHASHKASVRVLEKCGFLRESLMGRMVFPNMSTAQPEDCLRFVRNLD